jgi:hypothetical protein
MSGASSGTGSGYAAQRRYDNAYMQCMFAKGHRIPAGGSFTETRTQSRAQTPFPQQPYPPQNTRVPPPEEYIVPNGQ